jgi:polysaccharide pyruvyl transferase CsaB
MRYLLGGYYGMRNVGDDILLYVTLAEVARLDPAATFTILSRLTEVVPPGVSVRITPGGRRLQSIRELLRHDVWLFGGGGLLQDQSASSLDVLRRLRRAARVAKLMQRKIALVGIGVGPLVTAEGREASGRILQLADFVTVRDEESRDLAAAIAPRCTARVTADLAFLFPRLLHPASRSHRHASDAETLGVSLLPYAGSLGRDGRADIETAERMTRELNAVLRRHPNWHVKLFQFFAGSPARDDSTVLRLVQERLAFPDRVSYRAYDGDFAAIYGELGDCSAFLGMRFHSCVLAHLAGVPCLMIAYHPKSENLARRLRLSPEAIVALPLLEDSQALSARIEALLTNGSKFRPTIALHDLTDAAALNFTLLGDWLRRDHRRAS